MKWCLCILSLLIMLPFSSCAAQDEPTTKASQPTVFSDAISTPRQIIVISDLHFGEGKDVATDSWYRIEDFRWHTQFAKFLDQINRLGKGKTDLVINGDLFELWQSQLNDCQDDRGKDYGCTEEESLSRLERVLKANKSELRAIGTFAKDQNNRLIIIPGNHDAALLFPKVKEAALRAIDGGERVYFASNGFWLSEDKKIYIEHGHQIGRNANRWKKWLDIFIEKGGRYYLQRSWGETEMLRPSIRSTLNVSSVSETFKASGTLISTAKVFMPILHQWILVFFY